MRLSVGELLADRHAVRVLAFNERLQPPAEDVSLPEPVEGEFVLTGTGRTVCLRGRVRTVVGLICGACLRAYRQPLEVSVTEEFGRAAPPDEAPGAERELDAGDFVVPLEPGDTVDLTEVVRQHLVLALPLAARCREDCQGLCPHCGTNLNTSSCACDQQEIDPRLQPLRQWSRQTGREGGQ